MSDLSYFPVAIYLSMAFLAILTMIPRAFMSYDAYLLYLSPHHLFSLLGRPSDLPGWFLTAFAAGVFLEADFVA